ncbi:hypothetical protein FACS1894219_00420 [Clostridia bacterium]|nr:hypothetical protein FACS1894219_00420 [Clostridia bacterium]
MFKKKNLNIVIYIAVAAVIVGVGLWLNDAGQHTKVSVPAVSSRYPGLFLESDLYQISIPEDEALAFISEVCGRAGLNLGKISDDIPEQVRDLKLTKNEAVEWIYPPTTEKSYLTTTAEETEPETDESGETIPPPTEPQPTLREYLLGDGSVKIELYDKSKKAGIVYISMLDAVEHSRTTSNFDIEKAKKAGLLAYNEDPRHNYGFPSVKFPDDWNYPKNFRPRQLAELTVSDFSEKYADTTVGVFYDPSFDPSKREYAVLIADYTKALTALVGTNAEGDAPDYSKLPGNDTLAAEYSKLNMDLTSKIKGQLRYELSLQIQDYITYLKNKNILKK